MKFAWQKDPFTSTIVFAFLGGLIGIAAAILFGFLIYGIASAMISDIPPDFQSRFFLFPGMVVGVIVGSILGGVAGLRRSK